MARGDGPTVEDEAGTDEVAALAALIAAPARPQHLPDLDDEDAPLQPAGEDEVTPAVVLPRQRDEFTCGRCHLVVHVSRRAGDVCGDCS